MQNVRFPFMSVYKKTFVLVAVLLAVFIGSFVTRGLSQSIDFTGGRNYVVTFEKQVQPEQVRTILANAFPLRDRKSVV